MAYTKQFGLFFLILVIYPMQFLWAYEATLAINTQGMGRICSNSLQNCLVQISQNNTQCLPTPGSITITNNSQMIAKNIDVTSSNSNFINYVVKNNGCPASLQPQNSCTISFYTNTSIAFLISNVAVQGTNTNASYFDMQAFLCSINYIVTPSGDGNESITPSAPTSVSSGATLQFNVTANSGYTLSQTVGGTCPSGSWSGNSYTTGNITSSCSVSFSAVPFFPVAESPNHIIATPGNAQATISWSAPSAPVGTTIVGYTVTYGATSGTSFTTIGCSTSGLSCTVTGLANNVPYTFAVATRTTLSGATQTGPASLSSSVTPESGLVVTPSTLALSGLGGNASRTLKIINTSTANATINAVSAPTPALPGNAVVNTSASTDCSNNPTLTPGQSCTITINPGATATSSSGCALGTVPTPSVISINGTVNSTPVTVNANVVVLSYGCQYQGGYMFSIDDTTSITSSIGGKVVTISDQASGSSMAWSLNNATDSIWGIDDNSTSVNPSPNATSTESATFLPNQLNCNAANNGTCNTHNMVTIYGTATSYSAGLCAQPLNNAGTSCSGGSNCYTDWYLPSVCELGPFGSTGGSGNYPSYFPNSQACSAGTNIQNQLVSIVSLSGYYWSSTEDSVSPMLNAWLQIFTPSGGFQQSVLKSNSFHSVRCVRELTY